MQSAAVALAHLFQVDAERAVGGAVL